MGMYATLKGEKYKKCPKCDDEANWQSKELWLTYKKMKIWIGDEGNVELDENMNGTITAYGFPKEVILIEHRSFKNVTKGCGHVTNYKIVKGKLIEDDK